MTTTTNAFGDPNVVKKDLEDSGIVTNEDIEAKKAEIADIKEALKNVGITHNKTKLTKALHTAKKELAQLEAKEQASRVFGECAAKLTLDRQGKIEPTESNYAIITEALCDLAYDAASGRKIIRKDPPWERSFTRYQYWTDNDTRAFALFLSENGVYIKKDALKNGIAGAALKSQVNEMREMFNSLPEWDGTYRLPGLLRDFLSAEDITLSDARNFADEVFKMFLVATYKLAIGERIKWDQYLWFVGEQGFGKSTLLKRLAMKPEFFTESISFADMYENGGKTAVEKMRGKMIAELPECNLSREKKAYEAVKGFLSKDEDSIRLCYDQDETDFARICTLVGTTNNLENSLLPDPTGNRRFLIVQCRKEKPTRDVYTEFTLEFVQQLWAEVKACYLNTLLYLKDGDPLYDEVKRQTVRNLKTDMNEWVVCLGLSIPLPSEELWSSKSKLDRRNYVMNPSLEKIGLNSRHRDCICLPEVVNEIFGKAEATNQEKNLIKLILTKIGCVQQSDRKTFGIYGQQRIWWKIPKSLYEPDGELEFREDSVPLKSGTGDDNDCTVAEYKDLKNRAMQYHEELEEIQKLISKIEDTCYGFADLPAGKLKEIQNLIDRYKHPEKYVQIKDDEYPFEM